MTERIIPEIGKKAPAFTLPDEQGQKTSLNDLTGRWKVLYFYPKDDTPGCTTEACDFTDGLKDFEKLSATVIGVSPDSVESHQKFRDKYKLKVTLLSDPEKAVLQKYGAYGTKKLYGKETEGVIRSTFLIDPDNKIAHAWPNVKANGHAEQVMQKLRDLTD
jgi:peroxiredoxin Q/BCP